MGKGLQMILKNAKIQLRKMLINHCRSANKSQNKIKFHTQKSTSNKK